MEFYNTPQVVINNEPYKARIFSTDIKPEFTSGIWDCCIDIPICLKGCLLPCCLFGKNVEHLQGHGYYRNCLCYLLGCSLCTHPYYRRKLRLKNNIKQEPCSDFCTVFWCGSCALCQEAREIQFNYSKPPCQTMI